MKYKKIPNKYLLSLLYIIPFYYVYLFFQFPDINFILFISQLLVALFVSFILYYYGIWAAGDAKYLLILSLFIPNIGIIPFIGNLALVTIFYLFCYFFRFYLGKCVIYKGYSKRLYGNILVDLYDKWNFYKNNKGGKTLFIIIKWIIVFLIIFLSIRLSRIYFINEVIGLNLFGIKDIIQNYIIYIIFLLIAIFIGLIYLFQLLTSKIKIYLSNKYELNLKLLGNIIITIIFIILVSYITYELINNYTEMLQSLINIFTLYLGIYILTKIFIYSYKLTFGIAEIKYIHACDLRKGDIIDKNYLIQMFAKQAALTNEGTGFLGDTPRVYFQNIENPIDEESKNTLLKIYRIVNSYNLEHIKDFKINLHIKILNTFSFAPYIILGFIITFFLENSIFQYIVSNTIKLIFK